MMNRLPIEQLVPLPSFLLVGNKMNMKEKKENKAYESHGSAFQFLH